MADVSVTASAVVPTATTIIARGTAGATVTAGQAVYADPNANFAIKPAQATDQTKATNVVGIALDGASAGQPVAYATAGDVTFNSAFTPVSVYVLSANSSGGIAPNTDLGTGDWGTVLGMATSATNLRLGLIISGAQM